MSAIAQRSRGRRRTINEINMVPFIDVMLVLLIIFMVTAPLIAPGVVDLPSVGKAGAQPQTVIQISVGKDELLRLARHDNSGQNPGSAGVQTAAVAIKDIAKKVRQLQAGEAAMPVVISADRQVKYETVVKVMDALQRAGVQRVGLSVQLAP